MPYTENDGVKIYWEEHGTGDPLLLIMGLGSCLEMWHRTLPVVTPHYRTIVFDNRGVGRSDVPAGPYSIPTMASDAVAVMDAAGIEKARVYGISMGGIIAQELALGYPERVRSLILGCTTHGGPMSIPADKKVLDVLMTRGSMTVEEAIEAMLPFVYDAGTAREELEIDIDLRRRYAPTPEGYYAQLQGILDYESRSRLSQITAPTLVIHGETDQLIPAANGRMIASLIPGAKLVMIPNASHIFTTDQPKATIAAVLEFLGVS
jgi:pimeloyl-ACP methyl ester carboxylesterase